MDSSPPSPPPPNSDPLTISVDQPILPAQHCVDCNFRSQFFFQIALGGHVYSQKAQPAHRINPKDFDIRYAYFDGLSHGYFPAVLFRGFRIHVNYYQLSSRHFEQ